jgi:protein subunit release factor B
MEISHVLGEAGAMDDPIEKARRELARAGLDPAKVEERFARSSGPGGQNVNKVSTAVTLCAPGFTITASDSRSQRRNRELAWERLLERVRAAKKALAAAARMEREKKRRQNRKRPRGVKERILANKRRRSEIKKTRGRVMD